MYSRKANFPTDQVPDRKAEGDGRLRRFNADADSFNKVLSTDIGVSSDSEGSYRYKLRGARILREVRLARTPRIGPKSGGMRCPGSGSRALDSRPGPP